MRHAPKKLANASPSAQPEGVAERFRDQLETAVERACEVWEAVLQASAAAACQSPPFPPEASHSSSSAATSLKLGSSKLKRPSSAPCGSLMARASLCPSAGSSRRHLFPARRSVADGGLRGTSSAAGDDSKLFVPNEVYLDQQILGLLERSREQCEGGSGEPNEAAVVMLLRQCEHVLERWRKERHSSNAPEHYAPQFYAAEIAVFRQFASHHERIGKPITSAHYLVRGVANEQKLLAASHAMGTKTGTPHQVEVTHLMADGQSKTYRALNKSTLWMSSCRLVADTRSQLSTGSNGLKRHSEALEHALLAVSVTAEGLLPIVPLGPIVLEAFCMSLIGALRAAGSAHMALGQPEMAAATYRAAVFVAEYLGEEHLLRYGLVRVVDVVSTLGSNASQRPHSAPLRRGEYTSQPWQSQGQVLSSADGAGIPEDQCGSQEEDEAEDEDEDEDEADENEDANIPGSTRVLTARRHQNVTVQHKSGIIVADKVAGLHELTVAKDSGDWHSLVAIPSLRHVEFLLLANYVDIGMAWRALDPLGKGHFSESEWVEAICRLKIPSLGPQIARVCCLYMARYATMVGRIDKQCFCSFFHNMSLCWRYLPFNSEITCTRIDDVLNYLRRILVRSWGSFHNGISSLGFPPNCELYHSEFAAALPAWKRAGTKEMDVQYIWMSFDFERNGKVALVELEFMMRRQVRDAAQRLGLPAKVIRGFRAFRQLCLSRFGSLDKAFENLKAAKGNTQNGFRVVLAEEFVNILTAPSTVSARGWGMSRKDAVSVWGTLDYQRLGMMDIADLHWMCMYTSSSGCKQRAPKPGLSREAGGDSASTIVDYAVLCLGEQARCERAIEMVGSLSEKQRANQMDARATSPERRWEQREVLAMYSPVGQKALAKGKGLRELAVARRPQRPWSACKPTTENRGEKKVAAVAHRSSCPSLVVWPSPRLSEASSGRAQQNWRTSALVLKQVRTVLGHSMRGVTSSIYTDSTPGAAPRAPRPASAPASRVSRVRRTVEANGSNK